MTEPVPPIIKMSVLRLCQFLHRNDNYFSQDTLLPFLTERRFYLECCTKCTSNDIGLNSKLLTTCVLIIDPVGK